MNKSSSVPSPNPELQLDLNPGPGILLKADLIFKSAGNAALSPAQTEFNRLMKSLEKCRNKHQQEQTRLDRLVVTCSRELMPLIDEIKRVVYDVVIHGHAALKTIKVSSRRRKWFGDFLSDLSAELLADPGDLKQEQLDTLEKIIADLGPSQSQEEMRAFEANEFDFIRSMLENAARHAGVDLDLGDLDIHGDSEEFERQFQQRMNAAAESYEQNPSAGKSRARKPTKTQLERERKQREIEQAKQRDLKSLYKQLAKALHPDLETDPSLKSHKEQWMKRLTSAHAAGDLRELLSIEMEWLGEESSNLAGASDEKLKIYSMILKEQIADLKLQTRTLMDQPQYTLLHRFMDDFSGYLPDPGIIKRALNKDLKQQQSMRDTLKQGGVSAREIINRSADEHARASKMPEFPF